MGLTWRVEAKLRTCRQCGNNLVRLSSRPDANTCTSTPVQQASRPLSCPRCRPFLTPDPLHSDPRPPAHLPRAIGKPAIILSQLSLPLECANHLNTREDDTEAVVRRRLQVRGERGVRERKKDRKKDYAPRGRGVWGFFGQGSGRNDDTGAVVRRSLQVRGAGAWPEGDSGEGTESEGLRQGRTTQRLL